MRKNTIRSSLSKILPISLLIGALLFLLLPPQKDALAVTVLSNHVPGSPFNGDTDMRSNHAKAIIFEVPAGDDYIFNFFTVRLLGSNATYNAELYSYIWRMA